MGIKLEGGANANEGRIIVMEDGSNGTICDENWDDGDAKVICRMLGLS